MTGDSSVSTNIEANTLDDELWLEFEHWEEPLDIERDFFNMTLHLPDGRRYAFNVWTYGIFATAIDEAKKSGENLGGLYLHPPDLFVCRMERWVCERAIEDMIKHNTLPESCRVHDDD